MESKKVALVLTGYMRNWENNFQSIKKEILDVYNTDVYISSYTYSKWYWTSDPININTKKVLDHYKPKNYIFREKETCPKINFKENQSESLGRDYSYRQLYGWYTHKLSLNLFNFNDYETIIKIRPDIEISGLKIDKNNNIVIPAWKYHPGPCEANQAYVDYVAYGSPKYMKGYFSLYDKLQDMHNRKIDISLGETLLKKYLNDYVTRDVYEDDRIDWVLRGEKWASEKGKIFPPIL